MIDTAGKTGGHTHGKKAGGRRVHSRKESRRAAGTLTERKQEATGTLKGEPAVKVADILHKVAHRGTSLCKERGC